MTEFEQYISYFNNLKVEIENVTTIKEKQNHQKVVIATYNFGDQVFKTNRLYYKRINSASNVKQSQNIENHFDDEVYWLDIDVHEWPQSSGETDIDELIINDITSDSLFKERLLGLANNQGNGLIQLISKQGRSNQYYRNFENNNHWHDIILLIKAIINGVTELNPFLKPLVFRWDGNKYTERLRVSLSPYFGSRSILHHLIRNINLKKSTVLKELIMQEQLDLLKYKKQIILQGPPGTGKTRLAKELASSLCGITVEYIKSNLKVGDKLDNASGAKDYYTVKEVGVSTVSLVSDRTTQDWKPTYKEIIAKYSKLLLGEKIDNTNGLNPYELAVAKHFLKDSKKEFDTEQVKIIQFHPSYSYEDFVRGISVRASADGKGVVYETENKIFGTIIDEANRNLADSQKDSETLSYESWVVKIFDEFIEYLTNSMTETSTRISITDKVDIVAIEEDAFRYKGKKGWSKLGNRMLFDDVIKAIVSNNISRQDIKKNTELSGLAKWHASYYIRVVDLFRQFIEIKGLVYNATTETLVSRKEYVLIIDEINRANLSSVLGELIYALEYRNEGVKSMYSLSDSDELIIPDNLYIIGTMNTADRSVSQIDYAIRRRFAFIDVIPDDISKDIGAENFDSALFKEVSKLFKKDDDSNSDYLTDEFKPEQVQLGHSYFIRKDDEGGTMEVRWKYEILPILKEYVKDGILKKDALNAIKTIDENYDFTSN